MKKEKAQTIIIKPDILEIFNADLMTWDEWLAEVERELKEMGYHKYVQNFHNEDFAYWKNFWVDDEKAYQVGLLFYDFRKYANGINAPDRVGVQFECLFVEIDSRMDLSVSKDIRLGQFEEIARHFYDSMLRYAR